MSIELMERALEFITGVYFGEHEGSCADREKLEADLATAIQQAEVTDQLIESEFQQCGGKWNGDQWVIEDADLHPFCRAILALCPAAVPMIATRPQAMAKPSAWIDNSGHPRHLRYVQGVRERQLYGALQPLYEQDDLAAAVAAERERCAQLCEQWNATPGHKLAREIRGA